MKAVTGSLIVLALLVGLGLAGAGCVPTVKGIGTIEVRVTDAPPEYEVSSVMVTVSEVKVQRAGAEEEEGGWISLGLTGTNPFDLLQIEGLEHVLSVAEVEAGDYSRIHLIIEKVDVTLEGEGEVAVMPVVVFSDAFKFDHPFEVVADKITVLLFDFEVDRSVVVSEEGKVTVKPIAKITLGVLQAESR